MIRKTRWIIEVEYGKQVFETKKKQKETKIKMCDEFDSNGDFLMFFSHQITKNL